MPFRSTIPQQYVRFYTLGAPSAFPPIPASKRMVYGPLCHLYHRALHIYSAYCSTLMQRFGKFPFMVLKFRGALCEMPLTPYSSLSQSQHSPPNMLAPIVQHPLQPQSDRLLLLLVFGTNAPSGGYFPPISEASCNGDHTGRVVLHKKKRTPK